MSIRRLLLATTIASLLVVPAAGATQNAPAPVCQVTSCTITFPYVGDAYAWTVPANVSGPIAFDVVGAHGGVWPAGSGARVQASYAATAGEALTITPGGKGGESGAWTPGGGGFNGGGAGYYAYSSTVSPRVNSFGGGGGGASDVRTGGTGLASRILVAGGGGGGSWVEDYECYGWYCDPARYHGAGGDGGRVGGNGGGDNGGQPGAGASQAAGGAGGGYNWYLAGTGMSGIGGNGAGNASYGGGAGGGGGWYGGGGGTLSPGGVGAGGGGGGSSYASSALTGVTYTSGYGAGDGSVTATFTITDAPMLTAATPTPTATMGLLTTRASAPGATYAYRFRAVGSPAPTFSVASGALPAGMTLDPATGMLSGTPTQAGTYAFRIAATNASGTDTSGQLRITVGNKPVFTRMTASPTAGLHMRYRYVLRATGLPAPAIRVSSGALPPGLKLKAGATPGAAVLVGRPTMAGRYAFTLRAASTAGAATQRIVLSVAPQAPMVMEAPFTLTRLANGRLALHVKLMPMAGSPIRRAHVAVYARTAHGKTRQGDLPTNPGLPNIPDLGTQIANGTATAGAGATGAPNLPDISMLPMGITLLLDAGMTPATLPHAICMVVTVTGPGGRTVQQLVCGSPHIA